MRWRTWPFQSTPHVLGLDRDAPLALEVHRVEVLRAHVAGVDGAGELEDAVGRACDLPWSMWAMIEKLRMRARSMATVDATGAARRDATGARLTIGRWPPIPFPGCSIESDAGSSVANIKSQKKRNLTNAKRAERNKAVKSELKTRVEDGHQPRSAPTTTTRHVRLAVKRIDMAAAKGVIHKNQAARRKSRLMKKVNAAADGLTPRCAAAPAGSARRPARRPRRDEPGHQHLHHQRRRASPCAPRRSRSAVGQQLDRPCDAARRRAGGTGRAPSGPGTSSLDARARSAASRLVVRVGAVEAEQPAVVAVQDRHHLQRVALAGPHHPVQQRRARSPCRPRRWRR